MQLQMHDNQREVEHQRKLREEAEAYANHYRALSRSFAETASTGKRAGSATTAGPAGADAAADAPAAKRAAAPSLPPSLEEKTASAAAAADSKREAVSKGAGRCASRGLACPLPRLLSPLVACPWLTLVL